MLPRGIRNNNPLNIRRNPANHWKGRDKRFTDPEFETFTDIKWGLRAAFILVKNYIKRGYNTAWLIISKWAPPSENNTAVYHDRVLVIARIQPDTKIRIYEKDKLCRMLRAMAIVENGTAYTHMLDISLFKQAYDLAVSPSEQTKEE